MLYLIKDKMPHIDMSTYRGWLIVESMCKDNIRHAYEDLTTAYQGISDFVSILDGVCEGLYSPEEIIVAGIIITDAMDGYLVKDGYEEDAKYIRINGLDVILLVYDHRILFGKDLSGYRFVGKNRKRYKLRTRKAERSKIYEGSSHANDRSPEDE